MATGSASQTGDNAQRYLRLIQGLVRVMRVACYLDGECIRKDESTYIINGIEVRIPKEMIDGMRHCLDITIDDIMDAARRSGMSMVPLGLMVMRAWVCYGHAFSPCVIMHALVDELKRRGYTLKEMKALGDVFVVVK